MGHDNQRKMGMLPEIISKALRLVSSNREAKEAKDASNLEVQKNIEDGFYAKTRKGVRRIGGKMLSQMFLKMANRMKPLDFALHGSGRPEWMEKLVTDGVSTILQNGGYVSALRDKGGAFQRLLLYGDGYVMVGTDPDMKSRSPIRFSPISQENVYWDPYATVVRGQNGYAATSALAIFPYSPEEAKRLFPSLSDDTIGRIPRDMRETRDLDRSYDLGMSTEREVTEVGYFYDISEREFVIFAGRNCQELERHSGEDYPFVLEDSDGNGDAYIPILDFMCIPSYQGIWNHGFGEVVSDLAISYRQLLNMSLDHALDTANPIWNFNLPKGSGEKFPEQMRKAMEMRMMGKKGFITTEYDSQMPGANSMSVTPLMASSSFQEAQAMSDILTRELRRYGINLDESDYGPNMTATEIMAREEAAASTVKQIQEWNASETEKAVLFCMDFIKKFVKKGDRTPLNMTTMVDTGKVAFRAENITLGMVADELRKNDYFVKVNSRSGAIPSNSMKLAQLQSILAFAQPGSKAWIDSVGQYSGINDSDFKGEQFLLAQGNQEGPAAGEPDMPQLATDTSRLSINPRSRQVPV